VVVKQLESLHIIVIFSQELVKDLNIISENTRISHHVIKIVKKYFLIKHDL